MLDLENLEDQACIEALNKYFYRHFFEKRKEITFRTVMYFLEQMTNLFGSDGFQPGFGKLLGDMLVSDVLQKKDKSKLKSYLLADRIVWTHMAAIKDKTFNMYTRKLLHNYSREMSTKANFPAIFLYKGGY